MEDELPFPNRFKEAIISLASCEFDPTMSHKQAVFEFLMVHFIEDMTQIDGCHEDIAEAIEVCAKEIGVEVPVALVEKIREQGERLRLVPSTRRVEILREAEELREKIAKKAMDGESDSPAPNAPVSEVATESDAVKMQRLLISFAEAYGEEEARRLAMSFRGRPYL